MYQLMTGLTKELASKYKLTFKNLREAIYENLLEIAEESGEEIRLRKFESSYLEKWRELSKNTVNDLKQTIENPSKERLKLLEAEKETDEYMYNILKSAINKKDYAFPEEVIFQLIESCSWCIDRAILESISETAIPIATNVVRNVISTYSDKSKELFMQEVLLKLSWLEYKDFCQLEVFIIVYNKMIIFL